MSTREIATKLDASVVENLPTQAEMDEYLVRAVEVLDRTEFLDRFEINDSDPNVYYEWHKADDPMVHARLTQKGFKRDDELAKKSGFTTTDGAGNPRILDVCCYSIPRWKQDILRKVESEMARRAANPMKQEEALIEALRKEGNLEPLTTEKSSVRVISQSEMRTT